MQDPISVTLVVLAIFVIVTFTVLSLVYPTERAATDAAYKRVQHQNNDMLKRGINEYIVSYIPGHKHGLGRPEVQYLTDKQANDIKKDGKWSVEKVGDPLSEICDKPDDEWDKNYPM